MKNQDLQNASTFNHELNNLLINSSPDFIYTYNLEGRFTSANHSLCKAMNKNVEEIIGKTNFEIGFAKDLSKEWDDLFDKIKTTNKEVRTVTSVSMPENKTRFYAIVLYPLHDENETIIGIGGSSHDITDITEKEEITGLESVGRTLNERQNIIDWLYESQERLNKIILSSSDWIWEIDLEGKITFSSSNAEEIFGYTHNELMGKTMFDFLVEDEKPRVQNHFAGVVSNCESFRDFECCAKHKDGREVWILTNGTPQFDKAGNLKGYIGTDKDISIRKNTEKKLKELNARFTTLIEAIPDSITFKDSEGRLLVMNQAKKDLFGFNNIDWFGKTESELAQLKPNHLIDQSDEETWQAGKQKVFDQFMINNEGKKLRFEVTKVPLFEPDGKRLGMVIVAKDITKSKNEEERLKLLETFITNTTEGIIITQANADDFIGQEIIYVNDAYLNLTGYSREEIIGKTPGILQGPNTDKNELARIRKAIENNEPCEIEIINYKKNGEEFWSNIAIAPVFDENGNTLYWIGIKRDISDSKKQEQNVKKAIVGAQESEKHFIGRELHDNIAQLLVGSNILLGTIEGKAERDTKAITQIAQNIHKALVEIRNMSHQLAPAKFRGNTFILTISELLKSINTNNKFIIHTHFDDIDETRLSSDLQLNLYRILQEQLQNIIKHANATTIEVSIYFSDNTIKMRIYNNGEGFYEALSTRSRGLQNIKNRTEMFSGFYTINTSEGNGFELLINIPLP